MTIEFSSFIPSNLVKIDGIGYKNKEKYCFEWTEQTLNLVLNSNILSEDKDYRGSLYIIQISLIYQERSNCHIR
jgi:hypothetical protein